MSEFITGLVVFLITAPLSFFLGFMSISALKLRQYLPNFSLNVKKIQKTWLRKILLSSANREEFVEQLNELKNNRRLHLMNIRKLTTGSLANDMKSLFNNIDALGHVIEQNDLSTKEVNEIFVLLTSRLKKVNEAVGERYYIDMYVHPKAWTDVAAQKNTVAKMVKDLNNMLLTTLREYNVSREYDLKRLSVDDSSESNERSFSVEELFNKKSEKEPVRQER